MISEIDRQGAKAQSREEGQHGKELPRHPADPVEMAAAVPSPVGGSCGDRENGRGARSGEGGVLRSHCRFVMDMAIP